MINQISDKKLRKYTKKNIGRLCSCPEADTKYFADRLRNCLAFGVLDGHYRSDIYDYAEDVLYKVYKYRHGKNVRPIRKIPGLINSWTRYNEETYKKVYVLEAGTAEGAADILQDMGIDIDGYRSLIPGRMFERPAIFYPISGNRVIVTQSGGWDI